MLHNAINKPNPPLASIQKSFPHINAVYRQWAEAELQLQTAMPAGKSYILLYILNCFICHLQNSSSLANTYRVGNMLLGYQVVFN